MAYRDYYNVLGIERSASQDEVKKAYRALAMRFHPDRNQDDPETEQRFKDVTEAYYTLGDAERRTRYDRLGPLYNADGRPPRPEELNEAFGAMVGNFFRRKKLERGEDLRYTVALELEEVATGLDKEIFVPRKIRCRGCGGAGANKEGRLECKVCSGTGRASGPRLFRSTCYHCDGAGFTVTKPCETCSGEGRYGTEDSIRVKIPAGVATGQKLKLKGKGNAPKGSGVDGDLFVIVNVTDHGLFRRRGDDIIVELPLLFSEATLGADVTVPTLEGTTAVRIPPGTPSGKILRLAGRGLPRVGRSTRGDLHLQVLLEVPDTQDDKARELLTRWAAALPSSSHPYRAAFDEALRARGE